MNVSEIIDLQRSYIDETLSEYSAGNGDYSDTELLSFVNAEQDHLFNITRQTDGDWFGREFVFSTTSSVVKYYFPRDMIALRRLEMIKSNYVTGVAPFYVVDDANAEVIELSKQSLNEKSYSVSITGTDALYKAEGYHVFSNQLIFTDTTFLGTGYFCRIFYQPSTPKLHRSQAQAGGTNTITLGMVSNPNTIGTIKTINNYYQGMIVEIISGTGEGQQRWITQYVGSTKVATVDSNWDTAPDATSIYSIVSPIIEDSQELFALGGAIRAKGIKTEDDIGVVGSLYESLMADFKIAIESRNKHGAMRVKQTNWD